MKKLHHQPQIRRDSTHPPIYRKLIVVWLLLGCMLIPAGCLVDDEVIPPPLGFIRGTIRDLSDGSVIENARINVTPGNLEDQSNFVGRYLFADLKPATYQITASKEGFKPKSEMVRAMADSVITVDFDLEPVQVEDETPVIQVLYKLYGLNFSPYVNGQDPNNLVQIAEEQIKDRLRIVQPYTHWIRSFGSTHGLENIPRVAKEMGLKVAAGAWLDKNSSTNDQEISNLITNCNAGLVDIAIVGSETMLRKDLNIEQLISYISEVRSQVPDTVLVTTADVYGELLEHPEIIEEVDIVFSNIYPIWEGVPISCAIYSLNENYRLLVDKSKGKPVYISESGWSSEGDKIGDAVPSEENASFFFLNFVSWARANDIPYFYFAGVDENWKKRYEGEVGGHWGVFDQDGNMKPGMQQVFDDATITNNWEITEPIGGQGKPKIELTFVPEFGSFENLRGIVKHVTPSEYHLAVYIKVGGWWTKPTFTNPITEVNCDGSWVCDVTTGGADHKATEYSVFLLPRTNNPPLLRNSGDLPQVLLQNAVARIDTVRSE